MTGRQFIDNYKGDLKKWIKVSCKKDKAARASRPDCVGYVYLNNGDGLKHPDPIVYTESSFSHNNANLGFLIDYLDVSLKTTTVPGYTP